jgi:hypothetical protein
MHNEQWIPEGSIVRPADQRVTRRRSRSSSVRLDALPRSARPPARRCDRSRARPSRSGAGSARSARSPVSRSALRVPSRMLSHRSKPCFDLLGELRTVHARSLKRGDWRRSKARRKASAPSAPPDAYPLLHRRLAIFRHLHVERSWCPQTLSCRGLARVLAFGCARSGPQARARPAGTATTMCCDDNRLAGLRARGGPARSSLATGKVGPGLVAPHPLVSAFRGWRHEGQASIWRSRSPRRHRAEPLALAAARGRGKSARIIFGRRTQARVSPPYPGG